MPRVSIVIPTHNGERYVRRAIQSCVYQTYSDHEVIVVDDGSTDGTAEAVRDAECPVQYIRHDVSRGPSAARNAGIAASSGEMIAFLDSDDAWRPEKLALQIQLLDLCPDIEVVFSDYAKVCPNGASGPWRGGLLRQCKDRGMASHRVGPELIAFDRSLAIDLIQHTSFMHMSTILMRRTAIEAVGGFDEQLQGFEDLQLWIRLAARFQFGMVDHILVDVEHRPDSQAHRYMMMAESGITMYTTLHKHFPSIPPDWKDIISTRLAALHAELGRLHYCERNMSSAREHLAIAKLHGAKIGLVETMKTFLPAGLLRQLSMLKEGTRRLRACAWNENQNETPASC